MGFDDLARHMASRDGTATAAPTDANDFIRRAAEDNRRIDPRNNLILGTILLLSGLIVGTLMVVLMIQAADQGVMVKSVGGLFFAGASTIIGAQRISRGVRG
jgi:hypothetical protein